MLRSILTFSKAQISSFVGGVVDYGVMIALTELLHVHYTISIVFGGIFGAVVNFSLNRVWSFYSREKPYKYSAFQQLIMFCPVVLGSIALKSSGTFALTSITNIDYKITRLVVDAFVSIFFNYMLQRHWIFKKRY